MRRSDDRGVTRSGAAASVLREGGKDRQLPSRSRPLAYLESRDTSFPVLSRNLSNFQRPDKQKHDAPTSHTH